jgi:hypothetical protein
MNEVWHWQIFWYQLQKSIIMTIKHGLHKFFLIDMKVTAKIPCPQLYLIQKYLRGPPPKAKSYLRHWTEAYVSQITTWFDLTIDLQKVRLCFFTCHLVTVTMFNWRIVSFWNIVDWWHLSELFFFIFDTFVS